MAILNRYIIRYFIFLLLTGCYSEFDPDVKSEPVLCMNSLVTPGEQIEVSLTRTWRWNEGNERELDLSVKDAEVSLYVNDRFIENLVLSKRTVGSGMLQKEEDVYVAKYIPSIGENVKFVAHSKEYGDATAEVVIPDAPTLEGIDSQILNLKDALSEGSTPDNFRYVFSLSLKIWLKDNPDNTDWYRFDWSRSPNYLDNKYNSVMWVESYVVDTSIEPLFSEHVGALDLSGAETSGYTIFTDRQISGISYPLHIVFSDIAYHKRIGSNPQSIPSGEFYFKVESISRSYYDHVLSVWVANDGIVGALGSVGLGDAVFASSNVSTGAGVVAARSVSSITLNLDELLRSNGINVQ